MTVPSHVVEADVFQQVAAIIRDILELGEDEIDIAPEMTLTDDLGLESIDLVAIGAKLSERYGEGVNLADYLADMEMEQVIALNVESLVELAMTALSRGLEIDG
jgi:acyl carrier protein